MCLFNIWFSFFLVGVIGIVGSGNAYLSIGEHINVSIEDAIVTFRWLWVGVKIKRNSSMLDL